MKIRNTMILLAALAMLMISCAGRIGEKNSEPEPTAIVVDAETGEPIEGAVALAVWWGSMAVGGGFEGGGGIPVARRVEETVSDSKGRVYIDDFWDWHFFDFAYPHLSVYKCGYVCWNQHYKVGVGLWEGFDKENRGVRLEKWPKGFSFVDHDSFINTRITHFEAFGHVGLFYEAYDKCETDFRVKERMK